MGDFELRVRIIDYKACRRGIFAVERPRGNRPLFSFAITHGGCSIANLHYDGPIIISQKSNKRCCIIARAKCGGICNNANFVADGINPVRDVFLVDVLQFASTPKKGRYSAMQHHANNISP